MTPWPSVPCSPTQCPGVELPDTRGTSVRSSTTKDPTVGSHPHCSGKYTHRKKGRALVAAGEEACLTQNHACLRPPDLYLSAKPFLLANPLSVCHLSGAATYLGGYQPVDLLLLAPQDHLLLLQKCHVSLHHQLPLELFDGVLASRTDKSRPQCLFCSSPFPAFLCLACPEPHSTGLPVPS